MGKNRTGRYTREDGQRDTGATRKETKQAYHDARDDASKEKGWRVPSDRHNKGG